MSVITEEKINVIQAFLEQAGQQIALFYIVHGRDILDWLHAFFKIAFNTILVIATISSLIYLGIIILSFYSKTKKYKTVKLTAKNAPFVTIQIPTYNELAALNCAQKCLEFDYPKNRYEIIIGDDSNNEQVKQTIDEFAKKHPQIRVTRRGENIGFKPGNLNHMLTYSQGDYLLIFDSDYLPESHFLSQLVQPVLENPQISCVQARWKVANPTQNLVTILGTSIVETFHFIVLPVMSSFTPSILLCGSAELVNKKHLIELGGWRVGALTEDIDYSMRLISAGKKIEYMPQVTCFCEVPLTARDLYKQQMRWAYGVIRSLFDNKKNLSKSTLSAKFTVSMFTSGYFITSTLFLLFILGMLSLLTHPPAPIDWQIFFGDLIRNMVLTSGLLVAAFLGTIRAHRPKNYILQLVTASFSIGLVLVFYVVKGIYKAMTRQPMHWFMLKKNGNTTN